MSRGISIQVILTSENEDTLQYEVLASGWNQPSPDSKVGMLSVNITKNKLSFSPENDWQNEVFYIPEIKELQNQNYVMPEHQLLNENFRIWNYHLIRAIWRLINDPKYKEKVWLYH